MSDKIKSQADLHVLVAVDDLFFAARIESVARAVGTNILQVLEPEQLWEVPAGLVPRLIILDLNSAVFDPVNLLKKIKADARFAGTRVIGFYSHVQADLGRAADEAGCDQVLRRSTFVAKLPEILKF